MGRQKLKHPGRTRAQILRSRERRKSTRFLSPLSQHIEMSKRTMDLKLWQISKAAGVPAQRLTAILQGAPYSAAEDHRIRDAIEDAWKRPPQY